jgi:serine/threonine protein kinase
MEHIPGQTLHTHIRKKKAQGGYTADEFRKIASEVCAGLAAIHAQGLVHGDLKPGNVMVTEEKAVILDFGFAQERARAAARKPGAPPDGGTPNYMSPERLRSGGASADDDVYAMALTLWEMWTCRVPEPGYRRAPSRCAADHVRRARAACRSTRCGRSSAASAKIRDAAAGAAHALLQPVAAHDQPHPAPARAARSGASAGARAGQTFTPGAQAILVTYATNAPRSSASSSRSTSR